MKKRGIIITGVLMIFSLILCLIRFSEVIRKNRSIMEGYHQQLYSSVYNQYADHIPMEDMDLNVYLEHFAVALPAEQIDEFSLPMTINYYVEEDNKKKKAFCINKGVFVKTTSFEELQFGQYGYGFYSFPTYEKEWRFVRPFIGEEESKVNSGYKYYYIRTKDLIKLAKMVFKRNNVKGDIYVIDQYLYDWGYYCSPNMQEAVLSGDRIWLFVGGIISTLLHVIFRYRLFEDTRRNKPFFR